MPDISERFRAVTRSIRGYAFARTRKLELELSAVQRELSDLQDSYLDLSLQASTYARERETTLNLLRKTESYINYIQSRHSRSDAGRPGPDSKPGITDKTPDADRHEVQALSSATDLSPENNPVNTISLLITETWETLSDNIRETFTPYAKSLEIELSRLRKEVENLGNSYLELGDRANTLACQRESAVYDLKEAHEFVDTLFSIPSIPVSGEENTLGQASENRLNSVADRLHQTQVEKNDIAIKLAEREDQIGELDAQQIQLQKEVSELNRQLTSVESKHENALKEKQSLIQELKTTQADFENIRHDNRQRIEALEKRSRDLELQLATAHEQISDLESRLAEASLRREESDEHVETLRKELNEQHEKHENSLAAVSQKLQQTQCKKNDIDIKLAEHLDHIETLEKRQAQQCQEIISLKQLLAASANQHTIDETEHLSLTSELEYAREEYENASNLSGQTIDKLQKLAAHLESQLSTALGQVENLDQRLADATHRQETSDTHIKALEQELEGTRRKYTDNLNRQQERQVGMQPDSAGPSGKPPAGRRKHSIGWKRITAGFVFLLGVLASANRVWETDYDALRHAGVSKEVEPVAAQGPTATPSSKVIAIASLENDNQQTVGKAKPVNKLAEMIARERAKRAENKLVSPLSQKAKTALSSDRINIPAKRQPRARGPHSRTWFMEGGESMAWAGQPCRDRGLTEEECTSLRDNMFEKSAIRLPSGVQYTVINNGTGESPGIEDTVLVNYRGMLLDGQVFDSSTQQGGAVSFRIDEVIAGLQDVLQYMEEGAKWEVYIPGDLAYKKPGTYGGQTLVFEIELLSVEKPYIQDNETGQNAEDTFTPDSRLHRVEKDLQITAFDQKIEPEEPLTSDLPRWQQIENETQRFLKDNASKEDVISLPSGLQYKILKDGNGSGLSPRVTDTVSIHFRGTTPDGNEFDNSYTEGEPLTLTPEKAKPGWQEALLQMEEGAKWELYIPPALARGGETAKLGIRGQKPLIYEIELISINQGDSID